MKNLLLVLIILFFCNFSQAQNDIYRAPTVSPIVDATPQGSMTQTINPTKPETEGNVYSNPLWLEHTVVFSNDTKYEGWAKYDIYNKVFYFQTDEGMKSAGINQIKEYHVNSSAEINYTNAKYISSQLPIGFYRKLAMGKVELLASETVIQMKRRYVPMADVDLKPDYYVKGKKYYLLMDGNPIEVPTKKKQFVALFEDKQELVYAYIKKNKISLNSEEELADTVKHINTLK